MLPNFIAAHRRYTLMAISAAVVALHGIRIFLGNGKK